MPITVGLPSRDDLVRFFSLLVDKVADEPGTLDAKLAQCASLKDVRRLITDSNSLKQYLLENNIIFDMSSPPMKIDLTHSDKVIHEMFDRIAAGFSEAGAKEPYWIVFTHDKYKMENIKINKDEFMESGAHSILLLNRFAERAGIVLDGLERAIELGCGVGRVTAHLSKIFKKVVAVDIAAPLLQEAGANLKGLGCENVELFHLSALEHLDQLPEADCIYTVITLQHNPPPIIAFLIDKLLSKLKAGGFAYFQVPTYTGNEHYKFDGADYLQSARSKEGFEMHCLPQTRIFEIISKNKCNILEVREDLSLGLTSPFISNTFFLQKAAS